MTISVFSLPKILVSPAPPSVPEKEASSPFDGTKSPDDDKDCPRSAFLSPPSFPRHLSPLCPPEVPLTGQGLERERFERLLKASRERSVALGTKKAPDLRKELALKAQQAKSVERRAHFLMKVREPPTPAAINVPKTPPESPAMFHYSLPSPGLISPLEMYEQLEEDCVTSKPWIEQVDFRLPAPPSKPAVNKARATLFSHSARKGLPSLDQISARLTMKQSVQHVTSPHTSSSALQQNRQQNSTPIVVGRLQMPTRSRTPSPPPPEEAVKTYDLPSSPKSPELEVTTTIVPRTMPTRRDLTEANLQAFSRRADMLKTLRRRSHAGLESMSDYKENEDERNRRRRSAPAELPKRERADFKHPVLSFPGSF